MDFFKGFSPRCQAVFGFFVGFSGVIHLRRFQLYTGNERVGGWEGVRPFRCRGGKRAGVSKVGNVFFVVYSLNRRQIFLIGLLAVQVYLKCSFEHLDSFVELGFYCLSIYYGLPFSALYSCVFMDYMAGGVPSGRLLPIGITPHPAVDK